MPKNVLAHGFGARVLSRFDELKIGFKQKKPLFDHLFLAAPELEQQFFADDKGDKATSSSKKELKKDTKAGEILMSNPQAGAAVAKAFRRVHIMFDPADHVLRKVTSCPPPPPPPSLPFLRPRSYALIITTHRMQSMLVLRARVLFVESFLVAWVYQKT